MILISKMKYPEVPKHRDKVSNISPPLMGGAEGEGENKFTYPSPSPSPTRGEGILVGPKAELRGILFD